MSTAIYCRVSTDKQTAENQRLQLREFADKQGWKVDHEYVDVVSGSGKKARKQFERMMEDAKQGKFDVLLFWALDRLTREGTKQTLTYLEQLDEWGVAWKSFTEQYFDSAGPFKDVVISIFSTIAKQERLRISERTIAGLERARKAGKILGAKPKDVSLAEIEALQKRGLSLREIAEKLGVSVNTVQQRRGVIDYKKGKG